MQLRKALALLERAASYTTERLRQDRQEAPLRLQGVLSYLASHLFDPDLDVEQLRVSCQIRDHSFSTFFANHLGQPPRAYIAGARLETAAALLRDTELKVGPGGQIVCHYHFVFQNGVLVDTWQHCTGGVPGTGIPY